MDLKKFAVNPTGRLHLRDANDALMYVEGENGEPDESRPIAVNLFGPGSKQHAKATTAQSNRFINKLRRKGNSDQSTAERLREQAEFLADCTDSWENVEEVDGQSLTGRDLSMAIYTATDIGFIADQVATYLKEWGNFTKPSTTN